MNLRKSMKKIVCMLLTCTLLLSLAGCSSVRDTAGSAGQDVAEDSGNSGTHTVTDHLGNTVTVPNDIQRIAVCGIYPLPSVLAIFFDSAEKIVGMPTASMTAAKNSLLGQLYPDIMNANTSFYDGNTVNTEELMKLNPDVVFYTASSPEVGEELTKAGFAAVAVSTNKWNYNSIETLDNWIDLLSQIFPDNDKTEIVRNYSNQIYDMVQQRVSGLSDSERARVFFLFNYTDSAIATSGKSFFGQWWADAIGAKNVAEELTNDNSVRVNMEQIYKWNPDTVFITNFTTATPDDLYNNSVGSYDWTDIQAVADKNVHKMPLGMYRSYTPGADTPVTLLWLAKTTYPDLFSDIDITAETKSYYKTVFGIDLTDEQADSIFAPVAAAGSGF